MEKVYHIYAKNECIYHSLTKDEFKSTWNTLINMVGLMKTDYDESDFSYEELIMNKSISLESSH